jgi:translation initiation factor IF-3
MRKNNRKHKIGWEILAPRVRVVGEHNSNEIMSTNDARDLARGLGLDLILINEAGDPPIARIEDYKKFLYIQEKADKIKKKNAQKSELKEIQLSATIADNDLSTKAKKAQEFLEDGNKVKCSLMLKGRQKSMPAQGELVMLRFAEMCISGTPENLPKLEGSKWLMILKPKK